MSTPTIPNGKLYFDVPIWTGVGTSSAITISSLNFQPDLVWEKPRSLAYSHSLSDSVRGASNRLQSQATDAEQSNFTYGYTSSFNSNGFTATPGSTDNENWNTTGATFVAWCWKANGTAVSNTAGSITSSVSANTTSGFSVVTFTATGSNATVGHGLGVAPAMVIVKDRASAGNWAVYHQSLPSAAYYLYMNTTAAQGNTAQIWNSTAPTSTVFSIGTWHTADAQVAYCWAPIAGYSAFGSYTGNGSTDGPFVYTGFRPKFWMVKNTTAAGNSWVMVDTTRSPYNVANLLLLADTSGSEVTTNTFDILSNGIKLRSTDGSRNANGDTYIYMAFAENPFKYANAR